MVCFPPDGFFSFPQSPSTKPPFPCPLPDPDDQASAILLVSTKALPNLRRRGEHSQHGCVSYVPVDDCTAKDSLTGGFNDLCEQHDITGYDNSLSGKDVLSLEDSSTSCSPLPNLADVVLFSSHAAHLIPQHLLTVFRWNVDMDGPNKGEIALVIAHFHLLEGCVRVIAFVEVSLGLLSALLHALAHVTSPHSS